MAINIGLPKSEGERRKHPEKGAESQAHPGLVQGYTVAASRGAPGGHLPCPQCNPLGIFLKSHAIQPFEIKIYLLMGKVPFTVGKELSSPAVPVFSWTAAPWFWGTTGPYCQGPCPWAEGMLLSWWAHRLPQRKQEVKKATAMKRCPAKKIRHSSMLP